MALPLAAHWERVPLPLSLVDFTGNCANAEFPGDCSSFHEICDVGRSLVINNCCGLSVLSSDSLKSHGSVLHLSISDFSLDGFILQENREYN